MSQNNTNIYIKDNMVFKIQQMYINWRNINPGAMLSHQGAQINTYIKGNFKNFLTSAKYLLTNTSVGS